MREVHEFKLTHIEDCSVTFLIIHKLVKDHETIFIIIINVTLNSARVETKYDTAAYRVQIDSATFEP